MAELQARVRQNYWAILVAAVACFLFEAGWYTLFLNAWLEGIGRTMSWLENCGMNPALQYGTALVSAAGGLLCENTGASTRGETGLEETGLEGVRETGLGETT